MDWADLKVEDLLQPDEKDYGVRFMEKAEADYKNMGVAADEKIQRKKSLEIKLKKLTSELTNTRNVKNHRATEINAKIAARRLKIKEQINEIKDELYELKTQDSTNDQISKLKPEDVTDHPSASWQGQSPSDPRRDEQINRAAVVNKEDEIRSKNLEILKQHWYTDPFE